MSRPQEDIQRFMKRHPSPDVLEVHPMAWARKVARGLKCKNFKWSDQLCRRCTDYDKQHQPCFEESEAED